MKNVRLVYILDGGEFARPSRPCIYLMDSQIELVLQDDFYRTVEYVNDDLTNETVGYSTDRR